MLDINSVILSGSLNIEECTDEFLTLVFYFLIFIYLRNRERETDLTFGVTPQMLTVAGAGLRPEPGAHTHSRPPTCMAGT